MLGKIGEGDDRGWDGWMASSSQWTWVWVNLVMDKEVWLQSIGLQRVGHDWVTELNWTTSWGMPWALRGWQRKGTVLSRSPQGGRWGARSCLHLDLRLLASRAVRSYVSVVLSPRVCGNSLWQPQGTNTGVSGRGWIRRSLKNERECYEAESIAGVRRARAGGQRAGATSRQGPHQPCQGP